MSFDYLVGDISKDKPKVTESLIKTELYELVTQEKCGVNFSFNLLRIQPGGSVAGQSHPELHAVYILTGECQILFGGSWISTTKGYYGYIPANLTHSFAVPGDGELTEVLILKM